ncbi:MAG TPA: TA system VapC family ribonuclease toxin [Mycobacteriales bacterium]|nr:TA system VapC family ribonuclease toxin [Mycobacteriales bacterium]
MLTYLLDVNVLVALTWRDHVFHTAAQRWFAGLDKGSWATSTVTESSLVRVSMNRAVSKSAVSWSTALDMVATMRTRPGHTWWSDIDLVASPLMRRAPVLSYRQVTDVQLAALADHYGGRLATLDAGIVEALHPDDRALVHIIRVP